MDIGKEPSITIIIKMAVDSCSDLYLLSRVDLMRMMTLLIFLLKSTECYFKEKLRLKYNKRSINQ